MVSPTIKGIFVNSHIKAVQKALGDKGLERLRQSFGEPMDFKSTENVPIRTEVKLLECAVQLLSKSPIPPDQISFEAGRLHFQNFTTTPLVFFVKSLSKRLNKQIMWHNTSLLEPNSALMTLLQKK
jgi:uncharacterized protein (TIGR02265 family)